MEGGQAQTLFTVTPRSRVLAALGAGLLLSLLGSAWEPAASRLLSSLLGGDTLAYLVAYVAVMALLAGVSVYAGLRLGSPPSGGSRLAFLAALAGFAAAWLGVGGLAYGFARAPVSYSLGGLLLAAAYAALALHVWGLAVLALSLAEKGLVHESAAAAGLYSAISLAGYEGLLLASQGASPDSVIVYAVGRLAPAFSLGASVAYVALLSGAGLSALYSTLVVLVLTMSPVTPAGGLLEVGTASVIALYAAPLAGYSAVYLERLAAERPGRALALVAAATLIVAAALFFYASGLMVWRPIAVVTGSMEPAINRGDLVILERASVDEVEVGDVVAYRIDGTVVVHRVIEKGEGYLVTKGDANDSPDPYRITHENLLGRVAVVVPKVGWAIILLNWSPEVRLAVILVAAAIALVIVFRFL